MQKEMLGVPLDWSDPINQGLVMCLRMNEGMGDKIYDGSLNGNHGVLKNMTHPGTPTSGWTPGTRGVGLAFDGTDDYVETPNILLPSTFSMSAWFYLQGNVVGYEGVLSNLKYSAPAHGLSISPYLNGIRISFGNGVGSYVGFTILADVVYDKWMLVTATYNGTTLKVYLDGAEIYSNPQTISQISQAVAIGRWDLTYDCYYFNGSIDDVRIYNRALSAAEVMKLYIAGNPTSASVGQPVKYFIFDAETTAPSETFALPLEATGTYDFEVSWGDGNTEVISAWDAAAVTHTYASAGTHQIVINGTLLGWRFNNAGDCAKMRDIKAWGCLRLGNSNGYFYGCTGLTVSATDNLNLVGTTDLTSAFRSCSSLTTVPSMNSWDVSAVTSTYAMFMFASSFNQDISSWDVSSVIATDYMFRGASAFNQDISSWNISSATTIRNMFYSASSFNQDIGSWDVSGVTTIREMFAGATAFDQNLGSWDVTSVTDATDMFLNVTLSTANYDALLTGWEAQAVQNGVTFSGGNSKYSAGAAATARQALIDDHAWIVSDGGQV